MSTPVSSDFPGLCNFAQGFGGRFSKTFTYSVGGVPVDVTGWTATFTIRSSSATLLTATVGSGITLGGAAGTVAVAFTSTQMATVAAGSYQWTLTLTPSAGQSFPFMAGTLTVSDV
jgi:hypothetical protein